MRLFCPGPVNIHPSLKEIVPDEISHRGPDFQTLFQVCSARTRDLFRDTKKLYTPLFLTGSGTLAIESMIASYKGKGKLLLLQNGFFSEKWEHLLQAHKVDYKAISFGWGDPFLETKIEDVLSKDSFTGIFFVHHETSTTMINDIHRLNTLCMRHSLFLLVDAVSSVGMYDIDVNLLPSLTMLAYSTNKCIGSYPGLSVVYGKNSFLESIPLEITYTNLRHAYEFSLHSETPFTPCVQNFYWYIKAIEIVLKETSREEVYTEKKEYLLAKLEKLGMKAYIQEKKYQCCWVVNISCPNPESMYEFLYKKQFIIYKCKGILEKSYIQIAFLNKTMDEIDALINAMKNYFSTRMLEDLKEIEESS
jgi:2-aminoethylphosphonate-pyruvate transaminase